MKILLIISLILGTINNSIGQISKLNLTDLEGKWNVSMTNFPMWLKGDKINPTFNYSLKENKDSLIIHDQVVYSKNGKQKSIVGHDKPLNLANTKFQWRGKGLMKILTSKWEIIHFSSENNWMLIYFEKTTFTPEGYDVVTRQKELDEITREEINKVLTKNELNGLLTTLK